MAKSPYIKKVISVSDLIENPNNKRTITFTDYKRIEKSLLKFGQIDPLIVDKNNMLLSGHQRLKSLRKNKIKQVEVWEIQSSSDELLKAYNDLNLTSLPIEKMPEIKIDIKIDVEFKDVVTGGASGSSSSQSKPKISAGRLVKNATISMDAYNRHFMDITDQQFWANFINYLDEKRNKNN